jgi:hypothetical protein
MQSVYLIAAEPTCARVLAPALLGIGAISVHSCAWVVPWVGTTEGLRATLRPCVPTGTHLVISEISGGWGTL